CFGGALSHVVEINEREKAVDEMVRVTKAGGYIFCSVIGRLAVLITDLIEYPEEIRMDIFKEIRDTGNYDGSNGFTHTHFFLSEDLKELFNRPNLEFISLVGLEGLASHHDTALNNLFENDKKAFEIWWETHIQFCTHPAIIDTSEHILIICRKT
ncbi:MAG: hypothetical protein KAS62_06195, partial [Candidatus Delongbacteria bacterium]|nr:hypothetical protein [Candidatus Delongbacteria bacterium]